ncbi:MAG: hypothetical protein AAF657_03360 [Acidobacteriota bacterium]
MAEKSSQKPQAVGKPPKISKRITKNSNKAPITTPATSRNPLAGKATDREAPSRSRQARNNGNDANAIQGTAAAVKSASERSEIWIRYQSKKTQNQTGEIPIKAIRWARRLMTWVLIHCAMRG